MKNLPSQFKIGEGRFVVKRSTVVLLVLTLALAFSAIASAATPNLELVIPKAKAAPKIDGKLNDAAWLNASINGGKVVIDVDNTGSWIVDYPRVGYLTYDADALYVAFRIFAPDVTKLLTTDPSWWNNDEIEIFLDPNQKGLATQFGVTAGGQTNSDAIKAAIDKSGIRWTVEVAIPWGAVNAKAPAVGDKWGLNLTGHQIAAGTSWVAWNTTYGAFNNPSKFGVVTFGN